MAYTQVTLSELRTQLRNKWDNSPFWTTDEADYAINEALHTYNLYTGVWRQRVNVTTVAGQVLYTVPAQTWAIVRVEYNGKSIAMTNVADLDNGRPTWQSETTGDAGVPTTVQLWAPVGVQRFVIWPADATGNNSLLCDCLRDTPTLRNDFQTVDLDDSELDALLGEALYIASFKDPSSAPRTQGWHQEFLRTVMAHNGRLNASDLFRQAAGLDVARQLTPPST